MINDFTLEEFKRLYDTPSKSLIEKKIELLKSALKDKLKQYQSDTPNAFPMPRKLELKLTSYYHKEEEEEILKHFTGLNFEAKFEDRNDKTNPRATGLDRYFILSGWAGK